MAESKKENSDMDTTLQIEQSGTSTEQFEAILKYLQRVETLCMENTAEINNMKIEAQQHEASDVASIHSSQHCRSQEEIRDDHVQRNTVVDVAEGSRIKKIYDLPKFNGQPDEWPLFLANFKDTTEMFGYNNRENLIRLQKCLAGAAREAVVSLLIYPNDVPKVIEELQFRFGRPDILVKDQLLKLQQLPSFGESKLEQLVPFSTKVKNTVSLLKSAGCNHLLYDVVTLETLLRKIPPSKQYEWILYSKNIKPYPTIENFSEWLSGVARVVCLLPTASSKVSQNKSNLVMHMNENEPKAPNVSCLECKGQHMISSCETYQSKDVSDRWKTVKSMQLCFSCLKKGHTTANCRKKKPCGVNGCKRNHHSSLHEKTIQALQPADGETNQPVLNCQVTVSSAQLFKVIPVTLCGPKGEVKTYAVFDEGSAISLIDDQIASSLGLKGQTQPITLQWVGEKVTTEKSRKVCVELFGDDSTKRYTLKNVNTVNNLGLPTQTFVKSEYSHLHDVPVQDYDHVKPTILIGLDNAYLGVPKEVMAINSPIAMKTKLGWLVYGPKDASTKHCFVVLHMREIDYELYSTINEYFDTEKFGGNNVQYMPESEDNKRARAILQNTTRRIGQRFETGLLWKEPIPHLPDSSVMASNRLKGIERKMNNSSQFAKDYRAEMAKYFDKDYARVLKEDEIQNCSEPVWYLPHFAVKNVHKPNKCRIVFDAAATVNDVSLNSQLLKGPEQAKPLLNILFKFRQHEIGAAADIREMFSQIKIRQDDQPVQRFLWRIDEKKPEISHCVMSSMIFGAVCSPCSAEYIKNLNALEFQEKYPAAVDIIVNQHYVDDLVCSFSSESQAIETCQQIVYIQSQAGFELRRFVSNSKLLVSTMNSEPVENNLVEIEHQASTEKILGMQWNTKEDMFEYQTKFHRVPSAVLNGLRAPTKRELLSITMAVFDPYGFIADFLLQPKILMQKTWNCQIAWDEPVPEAICKNWRAWWSEFEKVKQLQVNRCYSRNLVAASSLELHILVDASEAAFAAVGYWRIESSEGIEVTFVMGKTRTAPKRHMSIPRLELQAAVLGARISKTISDGHDVNISRVVFWSDSRTVLHWIMSSERKYKAFVGHRIAEILELSRPEQWRWVPSSKNTADSATRLTTKYEPNGRWLLGPDFLRTDESGWPHCELKPPKQLQEEIRPIFHCQASICVININAFSSYLKLKRHVAWVLRALRKFGCEKEATNRMKSVPLLTTTELLQGEQKLCEVAQRESFAAEIEMLKKGKPIKKTSTIRKLQPYLDEDGLIRLYGRFDEANCLPMDTRRSILMPRNNMITQLLIRHYHERFHHQNVALVINEIRQRFWVPHIKNAIKNIRQNCSTCQIRDASPSPPLMGQLPEERVTPYVRPFTYTGVDLFGPIIVAIGRRREKRWVAIFTCLTIRAAHLEIVENLSTDAFLLSLRNFINRRGTPVRMRCDNGTNFIGAQKELRTTERLLDTDRIQSESSNKYIEWVFNCPANPSSGGCWERLIRICKRLLHHVLKNVVPRVETLRSVLIEAENIINSRPLTEVPIEAEEDNPITPNHFLLGCTNSTQTPHPYEEDVCLNKQWRIAQNIKNHFWKRWVVEYLPQLFQRPKWCTKIPPLQINDLVIICDPALPRSQWQKGRVTQVFPAKDGQVRVVEIRTSTGTFRRPANRVAALTLGKSQ